MEHPPPRPDGRIEITVTYLEMRGSAFRSNRYAKPDGLDVVPVTRCPVHFYRYLFRVVGAPWLWFGQCKKTDAELLEELSHPLVDLYVPYMDGAPAGIVHVDGRAFPDVELLYFGLAPEFIGRGIGGYTLDWTIERVWESGASRFWLHTCTLDSPQAIPVYKRAGFEPYRRETKLIADPRLQPEWDELGHGGRGVVG